MCAADWKQNDAKGEKVRISEHVEDVRGFVKTFLPGRSPVFVSHRYVEVNESVAYHWG